MKKACHVRMRKGRQEGAKKMVSRKNKVKRRKDTTDDHDEIEKARGQQERARNRQWGTVEGESTGALGENNQILQKQPWPRVGNKVRGRKNKGMEAKHSATRDNFESGGKEVRL